MKTEDRYRGIIGWFSENMPAAQSELQYKDPYQLLVAVILSAQCTDKRVNPEFGGVVPSDIQQMQRLPGVGRKTANVVGSVMFDKQVMPVDTHVFRVSARIGLTRGAKTPLQTELQLTEHIPSHLLPIAHHWLILHGRYVCTARNPHCSRCGISRWCKKFETDAKQAQKSK